MKKETLFDITEQISEDFIAEAMPHRLKHSHAADPINEKSRKGITVTKMTRYITTGLVSAAAVGVVVGCGFFIHKLNSDHLTTPAQSPSSQVEELIGTQTPATEAQSQTVQTTASSAEFKAVTGKYGRDLTDSLGIPYELVDGKPKQTTFENSRIVDGQYSYYTKQDSQHPSDYVLYREDGTVMFHIEPEQFITHTEDMEVTAYFSSITAVGEWFFTTVEIETFNFYYDENGQKQQSLIDSVQQCYWFDPVMNEAKLVFPAHNPNLPEEPQYTVELTPQYIQADPDGGAVYGYSPYSQMIYRFPVPEHNSLQTDKTTEGYNIQIPLGTFEHSQFAPAKGGKVYFIGGEVDKETDKSHISWNELDMNTGEVRMIEDQTNIFETYTLNGRILCIDGEKRTLLEYLPESNTYKLIAQIPGDYSMFTSVWEDSAVITAYTNCGESSESIFVSSIENGTFEKMDE